MLLQAGRGGGAVVEGDADVPGLRRVVDHLHQAGDAAVDEGAVADDGDDAAGFRLREHVAQAQARADAGAHADAGVHRLEGRQHPEGVAADVAGHDAAEVPERLECGPVRAALAEGGGLALRRRGFGGGVAGENPTHAADVELAEAVHLGLPFDGDAGGAELLHEDGVALFDDDAALHRRGEAADGFDRKRIGESRLEDAGVRGGLAGVLEGDPGGDEAEGGVAVDRARQFALFVPGRDGVQALAHPPVGRTGVGRDHDAAGHVLLPARRGRGFGGAGLDDGLAVADPRGEAEKNGHAPCFREGEGAARQVVGFLRVGRLEHRHAGGAGVTAAVLFVLAGRHAGVVGADNHQAAGNVGVGDGEERVGRNVEPHVLHGHQGAGPPERGADADLEGDLFVRRPLGRPAEVGHRFENLGRGGAGVPDAQGDAGIDRGAGHRFVAGEKQAFRCCHAFLLRLRPGPVSGRPEAAAYQGIGRKSRRASRPPGR